MDNNVIPTQVVLEYVDSVAKRMGVDSKLAKSIVLAENMGKDGQIPTVIAANKLSPKQAFGVSQVTPDTYEGLKAQGYLPADHSLESWQGQIDAGVAALKAKSKEHKTNDPIILAAAYNGGNNGAKLAAGGNYDNLPAETKDYLNKLRMADAWLTPRASQRDVRSFDRTGVPDPSTVPATGAPSVQVQSISATPTPGSPNDTKDKATLVLEQGMEQNRSILEGLIKEVTKSTEDAATSMGQSATELFAAGVAEGQAAEIQGVVKASTEQIRERNLQISNLDTRKADNEFARLLSERVELQRKRDPVRKDIDERLAVGLFDNPIQYLINQTVLPGRIQEHNALARRERDNIAALENLQGEVRAQNDIAVGPTADLYLKHGMALADAATAKARAEAEKMRAQASGLIAQRVLGIASLRETIIRDQERYDRWKIILADQREKNQKTADDLERERDLDRRLAIIGNAIGAEGLNVSSVKRMTKADQDEVIKRANTLSLGDNFADAYEFIERHGDLENLRLKGGAEFADMMRAMQNQVRRRGEEIRNTWAANHPELATKPPSAAVARRMAAEEAAIVWEGAKDNNMLSADRSNPYLANHQKMARVWQGNPNNPIYLMVKEADRTQQLVNDNQLLEATRRLVRTGTLRPSQAATALSEYYKTVIDRNNADRNLKSLGLSRQEEYRIRSKGPSPTLDLTNTVAVENHLTMDLMQQEQRLQQESMFGTGESGVPFSNVYEESPATKMRFDREKDAAKPLEDVINKRVVPNPNNRPANPNPGGVRG